MFKKVMLLFCLLFGVNQATAAINFQTVDFTKIPLQNRGENALSDILRGYQMAQEPARMRAEAQRQELEIQIMEQQLRMLRQQNATNHHYVKAQIGRAKTVRVRGYYRKNGTYVRQHYRSPPTRKSYKRNV